MELTVNDQLSFQQNLQRFKFSESRSILIHTDYKTAREKGQRFVKMYVDNGNELPFYETNQSNGLIEITKDSVHKFQISLWDIYNNNSQVHFEIAGETPAQKLELPDYRNATKLKHKLSGNNLVIGVLIEVYIRCVAVMVYHAGFFPFTRTVNLLTQIKLS